MQVSNSVMSHLDVQALHKAEEEKQITLTKLSQVSHQALHHNYTLHAHCKRFVYIDIAE